MITKRELLDDYQSFRSELSWLSDFRTLASELPPELSEVILAENKLLPRHCTPEVIKEFYLERLCAIQPAFTLDEHSGPAVELISHRIARSGDFESLSPTFGLNKGIMLLGGIGTGKTLLMRGLVDVYYFFELKLKILPTYAITEDFATNGPAAFGKIYHKGNDINPVYDSLVIDDFGAEAIASHYGLVTNVIAEVMLRRYDQQAVTFGTSNLDQKTLRKFYGDRVWSRMKAMFNFIELKGNDRRK